MMAEMNLRATVSSGAAAAKARPPHLLFHNVLGTETVTALLDYVAVRQRDFTPGMVKGRQCDQARVDRGSRNWLRLGDLGEFMEPFRACLDDKSGQALQLLGLLEPAVEANEFEICAYGDGGFFEPHIDTGERVNRIRILSCVYYFAKMRRRFSGGNLRLHDFPTLSCTSALGTQTVDIMPETDTLVIFPSWLRHEVTPIEVPSKVWADGRFTINCWMCRVSPPADAALSTG